MSIDDLRGLLAKKELKVNTPEDKEKVELLKDLFIDDGIFFKIDIETAFGILDFLEVPEEKIKEVYFSLISYKQYEDTMEEIFTLN